MRPYSPRFDNPLTPWQAVRVILLLAAILGLTLWLTAAAWAQPVTPIQRGLELNSQTTGTGGIVLTLTPIAAQSIHLYKISARCATGTGSFTVTNGSTTWYSYPAAIAASQVEVNWTTPLTGTLGTAMGITLGCYAGAAGSAGTLDVQADQY